MCIILKYYSKIVNKNTCFLPCSYKTCNMIGCRLRRPHRVRGPQWHHVLHAACGALSSQPTPGNGLPMQVKQSAVVTRMNAWDWRRWGPFAPPPEGSPTHARRSSAHRLATRSLNPSRRHPRGPRCRDDCPQSQRSLAPLTPGPRCQPGSTDRPMRACGRTYFCLTGHNRRTNKNTI